MVDPFGIEPQLSQLVGETRVEIDTIVLVERADAAITAVKAESIPPLKPIRTLLKPHLVT